ncbi:MAG: hypothetical protein NWE89_11575, partial [Candidatus Bathyarchaeota archaeon]|nr:hypothetical protein [Candidatus Bathyarchaeota archaeon]
FELSKDCPMEVHNYMTNKLPQDIFNINYYKLKDGFRHSDLIRVFDRFKENDYRKYIEAELTSLFGDEDDKIYFDVVSVQSLAQKDQIEIMYSDEKILPLWEGSKSLSDWKNYFDEQWKMYIFKYCKDKREVAENEKIIKKYFNFLSKETNEYSLSNDDLRLEPFEKLYDFADKIGKARSEGKVYHDTSFRDKIFKLSVERRQILKHIYDLNKARAIDIAEKMGTKRVTAAILLKKLRDDDLLLITRDGREIYYRLAPQTKAELEK